MPGAGNPDNAEVWAEADVLIGTVASVIPVGGAAFALTGADKWSFVGLLDGGQGFSEAQTNDATDHNAWGFGVVATTRRNLAITKTFTVLEENLVTLALFYDTSGLTFTGDNYAGDLAGRDLTEKFRIAFATRSGGVEKRRVSKNFAQIDSIGDATEGEDALESRQVTVKIYPDDAGIYWYAFKGAPV